MPGQSAGDRPVPDCWEEGTRGWCWLADQRSVKGCTWCSTSTPSNYSTGIRCWFVWGWQEVQSNPVLFLVRRLGCDSRGSWLISHLVPRLKSKQWYKQCETAITRHLHTCLLTFPHLFLLPCHHFCHFLQLVLSEKQLSLIHFVKRMRCPWPKEAMTFPRITNCSMALGRL